jgi:hypothetical protein
MSACSRISGCFLFGLRHEGRTQKAPRGAVHRDVGHGPARPPVRRIRSTGPRPGRTRTGSSASSRVRALLASHVICRRVPARMMSESATEGGSKRRYEKGSAVAAPFICIWTSGKIPQPRSIFYRTHDAQDVGARIVPPLLAPRAGRASAILAPTPRPSSVAGRPSGASD